MKRKHNNLINKMKKLLLVSCLLLGSCANQQPPTIQHPGAVNAFDNYAYDTLRIEEKALLEAKAHLSTTPLIVPAYNAAKEQYNTTIAAYKTYHLALVAGQNPDNSALAAQITELVAKVLAL